MVASQRLNKKGLQKNADDPPSSPQGNHAKRGAVVRLDAVLKYAEVLNECWCEEGSILGGLGGDAQPR